MSWGLIDQANNRPTWANTANVFGITSDEVALTAGIAHAGWVQRTVGSGPVVAVNVVAGGTGYANNAVVTFTGGGGTGAAATVLVGAGGAITSVVISDAGSGYTSAPTATVAGDVGAAGAALQVVLGGRAGRTTHDTLVALSTITNL